MPAVDRPLGPSVHSLLKANRVAIAISSYRSDDQVVELLRRLFGESESAFHSVIVVDSLGVGRISAEIKRNSWPVEYVNSSTNLGSAGNLELRLKLAADRGANWCYCVNHDGNIDPSSVMEMLRTGLSKTRVGAVYPVLHHGIRRKPYEHGRQTFFPSAGNRRELPPDADREVVWGSSNGALYSLCPYKEGLRVWADLWMGYEDLAYGMALERQGWGQLLCSKAILRDIFDYKAKGKLGKTLYIPDKPPWYSYYGVRNLLLISKVLECSWRFRFYVVSKFAREIVKIISLESEKAERLRLVGAGIRDGFAGRSGKWKLP